MNKNFIFLCLLLPFVSFGDLYKKGWGWRPFNKYLGTTLSLNPDKSYTSTYFDFKNRDLEDFSSINELDLYKKLFIRSLLPSYILFELTYYPLTDLGGYLYKHKKDFYDNFSLKKTSSETPGKLTFNLIGAMASRFESPYIFSLFLGDIVPFLSQDNDGNKKQFGSALMGFVLSFSQRRMKLIEIHNNNWIHFAWKLRGTKRTKINRMTWKFELGYFHHFNKEFINALSLSILRDKLIFGQEKFSLLHNSKIEYSFHVPLEKISQTNNGFSLTKYTTFQKIVAGLNFPLRPPFVLTTEMGFKWEALKDLDREKPISAFSFILLPGLKW